MTVHATTFLGGRPSSHFTPFTIQAIVEVLFRLKMNDVPLLLGVLNHVRSRLYDYPPVWYVSRSAAPRSCLRIAPALQKLETKSGDCRGYLRNACARVSPYTSFP